MLNSYQQQIISAVSYMKTQNILISVIIFSLVIISCSGSKNNDTAFLVPKNNQIFLQLTGKRLPLVHDPISAFTSKAINDTLLINIPYLKEGIINGRDIPVEEGYYKYQGYINFSKETVSVKLQIIDSDSKKNVEEPYNGMYKLIRK